MGENCTVQLVHQGRWEPPVLTELVEEPSPSCPALYTLEHSVHLMMHGTIVVTILRHSPPTAAPQVAPS